MIAISEVHRDPPNPSTKTPAYANIHADTFNSNTLTAISPTIITTAITIKYAGIICLRDNSDTEG